MQIFHMESGLPQGQRECWVGGRKIEVGVVEEQDCCLMGGAGLELEYVLF